QAAAVGAGAPSFSRKPAKPLTPNTKNFWYPWAIMPRPRNSRRTSSPAELAVAFVMGFIHPPFFSHSNPPPGQYIPWKVFPWKLTGEKKGSWSDSVLRADGVEDPDQRLHLGLRQGRKPPHVEVVDVLRHPVYQIQALGGELDDDDAAVAVVVAARDE